MLDTHCRKYIQPFIKKGANIAMALNLTANNITVLAMIIGVLSGVLAYFDKIQLSISLLWISGYLDAVDGTIARETKSSSPFGTVMDITFDRIVEGAIILAISLKDRELSIYSLFLALSIIISMTIFLTTGPLLENKGEKSFHYQAGLAERSEGFIMLTLMILFKGNEKIIINIFTGIVLFTAIQRFLEAKRLLK